MKNAICFTIFFTVFCSSCSLTRNTEKDGIYQIERFSSKNKAPTVYGTVFSYETKKPLQAGVIKMDEKIILEIDPFGNYKFNPKKGSHRFASISVPYHQVTTQKIMIKEQDSIKIDFYLKDRLDPTWN